MLIHESCMTCEECQEVGHTSKNCPVNQEDVNYLNNNNYRRQNQWNQNEGWNQ